jgi:NAD(P)H dehydrogenase (quinone)
MVTGHDAAAQDRRNEPPVIAVTGATGALGGRVVRRLSEAAVPLRAVVRDAARAPQLPGVEIVENPGGYSDPAGFTAALRGVHTLYLVSAAEAENRLEQHFAAVDAAAAAGVQRIVYTSFVGAGPDAAFTLVRQHHATEERIRATGIPHTLLRHSMYADFVPFFATIEGDGAVIAAPAGKGRTGFVSRDDLADVGVAVLLRTDGALDGQALDVTGPEALTMAEAAAVLTEITGRPTTYREETLEEAWASRRPSGHPDWEIEGWVTSYVAIAEGELASVTDVVPRLTGHPALTVAEHLRRHPEDWAALRS